LNGGPVNDSQHFFGDGLTGWKKTCAQAGDGNNCFTNFHAFSSLLEKDFD
jgi:hypothetical protein